MPTDSRGMGAILEPALDCKSGGFGGDATASGRLLWLERGGHCFEPHVLRRLLGRIVPICNRGEGFDEVLLQD